MDLTNDLGSKSNAIFNDGLEEFIGSNFSNQVLEEFIVSEVLLPFYLN